MLLLVLSYTCQEYVRAIYYIKLQCPFVCVSVPPFFLTRPSNRNQIWHTFSDRYGTHSQLKKTLGGREGSRGGMDRGEGGIAGRESIMEWVGAYGMEWLHHRQPERSRVTS